MTVPKVVRVVVTGDARGVLSPKDLVLHLIGDPYFREEQWRTSPTDCVIHTGGDGLDQWNVDELSVITNMTVEGGLMTGVVEPCQPRLPPGAAATTTPPWYPDEGATYERVIHVNLDEVPLMSPPPATPGTDRASTPPPTWRSTTWSSPRTGGSLSTSGRRPTCCGAVASRRASG